MATVAELIEQLKKLDQSAKVIADGMNINYIIKYEGNYWLDTNDSSLTDPSFKGCKLVHEFE